MLRRVDKETSELVLSERGLWYHRGEPFENDKIIAFFHQAIRKDAEGRYYLFNQFKDIEENVYFAVEDTAYFIWQITFDETSQLFRATLNTGAETVLDLRTLSEDERGVMYCRVLDNDRARLSPRALAQLADHAVMDGDQIHIDKTGEKILLP